MNQRKTSRAFYLFEQVLEEMPGFAQLRRPRSIAELQLLAGLVWACERGRGDCPRIEPLLRGRTSYFLDGKIRLLRKHRDVGTLLHELAHALGTRDKYTHGPAFKSRCLRLFKQYGDWNGEVT